MSVIYRGRPFINIELIYWLQKVSWTIRKLGKICSYCAIGFCKKIIFCRRYTTPFGSLRWLARTYISNPSSTIFHSFSSHYYAGCEEILFETLCVALESHCILIFDEASSSETVFWSLEAQRRERSRSRIIAGGNSIYAGALLKRERDGIELRTLICATGCVLTFFSLQKMRLLWKIFVSGPLARFFLPLWAYRFPPLSIGNSIALLWLYAEVVIQ